MKQAIPIIEIMSKDPITISPDASAVEAANLMRSRAVGSLLVVSGGKPIGIVTEKDFVTKVTAEDRKPSTVKVKEVMTSPVVTVDPYQEILEAAKTMADLQIRRLAVVDDDTLIGLITENDILKVWPALIEITRERAEMATPAEGVGVGYCETCSTFSESLNLHNGQLVCPECREE